MNKSNADQDRNILLDMKTGTYMFMENGLYNEQVVCNYINLILMSTSEELDNFFKHKKKFLKYVIRKMYDTENNIYFNKILTKYYTQPESKILIFDLFEILNKEYVKNRETISIRDYVINKLFTNKNSKTRIRQMYEDNEFSIYKNNNTIPLSIKSNIEISNTTLLQTNCVDTILVILNIPELIMYIEEYLKTINVDTHKIYFNRILKIMKDLTTQSQKIKHKYNDQFTNDKDKIFYQNKINDINVIVLTKYILYNYECHTYNDKLRVEYILTTFNKFLLKIKNGFYFNYKNIDKYDIMYAYSLFFINNIIMIKKLIDNNIVDNTKLYEFINIIFNEEKNDNALLQAKINMIQVLINEDFIQIIRTNSTSFSKHIFKFLSNTNIIKFYMSTVGEIDTKLYFNKLLKTVNNICCIITELMHDEIDIKNIMVINGMYNLLSIVDVNLINLCYNYNIEIIFRDYIITIRNIYIVYNQLYETENLLDLKWLQCTEIIENNAILTGHILTEIINYRKKKIKKYNYTEDENILPEQIDPLTCNKIIEPILIPNNDMMHDITTIYYHIFDTKYKTNESTNPYTKMELTIEQLIEYNNNNINKIVEYKNKFMNGF